MTGDVARVDARRELEAIRHALADRARARLPRSVTVVRVEQFDPRPDGTVRYSLVLTHPKRPGHWVQTQLRIDPELAAALTRIRRVLGEEPARPASVA